MSLLFARLGIVELDQSETQFNGSNLPDTLRVLSWRQKLHGDAQTYQQCAIIII